eukprot:TRINITY_DN6527_c0_g1_i1.p1 TRINITY_DN6527_c0_g1~~TRINITY_DN6527_c0_g1_i1.p1  ORF type:complete len:854 (-),score=113.86 TRINITY_DN6527_c0_g1_i1:162-2723(-)
MAPYAITFALCLSQPFLIQTARIGQVQETSAGSDEAAEVTGKASVDEQVSIHFNFNSSVSTIGNKIGALHVKFPNGGSLTNQGFAQGPLPYQWTAGSLLGKADDMVWPIMSPQAQMGQYSFAFDHLVSDLVFGDVQGAGSMYRPEFEEVVYSRGASSTGGTTQWLQDSFTYSSPQKALEKMLAEEIKESGLKFAQHSDLGYVYSKSARPDLRYNPQLKLADPSKAFAPVQKGSRHTQADMIRPSILDIDNLFAEKPVVPNSLRASSEVARDSGYQHGRPTYPGVQPGVYPGGQQFPGGYPGVQHPGVYPGGQPHTGGYPGGQHPGVYPGGQPHIGGYPAGQYPGVYPGGQPHTGGYPGGQHPGVYPGGYPGGQPGPYNPQGPYPGSNINPGRCYLQTGTGKGKTCKGQCTTKEHCHQLGGSFKQKYCTGSSTCGCCKTTGRYRSNFLQTNSSSEAQQPYLPVEISVQWLIPVLQKFRCVSVSPQYSMGSGAIFIAMGWDTESIESAVKTAQTKHHLGQNMQLDLDLSLVPLDKAGNIIPQKMVWYKTKTPHALGCGYGQYAMRSFVDDQSGEGAGDDELVKIDLNCLSSHHPDIDAIVVMVNIFSPRGLHFTEIDSAYLRIVSGGHEQNVQGNFVVNGADGVRSYIRLSGNDLKRDPDIDNSGLAVGMFFRQPTGTWAFGSLMAGMPGSNIEQSAPSLVAHTRQLVYPANSQWDQTVEHQQAIQTGAFGEAGLLGKGHLAGLVQHGQLPCISTKADQALLLMGHMKPDALDNVIANPKVPENIKKTAESLRNSDAKADHVRKITLAVDRMEGQHSQAERDKIGKEAIKVAPPPVTDEESNEAVEDLDDLFSAI